MSDQSAPAPLADGVIVAETRLGKFQVEARGPAFTLLADEPRGVGGLGSGPDPYDLLSIARCT
jgi:putative redox protein